MTDAPEQPELTPEDEADILAWIEQEQQAAMGGTPEPPAPPVEDVAEGSAPEAEDVPEGAAPSVEDVAEGMAPVTEDVPEGVVPPVEYIPATTLPDDVTPEQLEVAVRQAQAQLSARRVGAAVRVLNPETVLTDLR